MATAIVFSTTQDVIEKDKADVLTLIAGMAKAGSIKSALWGLICHNRFLYSSLGNIIPDAVAANEVNTAILLSDGDTYLTKEQQRTRIANWTKQNSGKVSLYGIASGAGNNLPLLDVLSAFNKGALYYASRDEEINDVLVVLMRLIQNPIAKDIIATPITPEAESLPVLIYPPAQRLPNMYENGSDVVSMEAQIP